MGSKSSKATDTVIAADPEAPKEAKNNGKAGKGSKKNKDLLIDELDEHEGPINCMTLSDDGSLLVTGGEDSVARMWCTKTPSCECLGALEGHSSYITCIAIVDTYVITGSADNTARKWDMTNCECLFVFEGHKSRICRIICTNEFVFTTSYDKTARVWIFNADALGESNSDKACLRVLKGHTKGVYPLVFIPAEGIPTEVEVGENQMDINPSDLLITGSADCTARSWSVDTGGCIKVFEGHTMPIMCMASDNAGETLFTAGGDKVIFSWEIKSGNKLKEFSGHSSSITGLQVVNRLMYTTSCDQTVRAWVTEFGDCTRVFQGHEHSVTCFRYVDGYVFTGCGDGIVRAFDAKSGTLRQEYKGHNGAVSALATVDRKLYTSSVDGKLRVWNASHLIPEQLPVQICPQLANSKTNLERNNKKLKELEDDLDGYVKEDPVKNIRGQSDKAKTDLLNDIKKVKVENGAAAAAAIPSLPGAASVGGGAMADKAKAAAIPSLPGAASEGGGAMADKAKEAAMNQANKGKDAALNQAKKLGDKVENPAKKVGETIAAAASKVAPA